MNTNIDRTPARSNSLRPPAFRTTGRKLVCLSALLVCCGALAQEPKPEATKGDPAQVAMVDYYDCTRRYADKYSRSREPAQDIADAALSYCENARERLRTMLIDKLSAGGRSAREQVNNLFPGIIEKARLLGIRVVVEARYEASLGGGAVQSGVSPALPSASIQPLAPDPAFSLPLIEGTAQAFPLAPTGSGAQPALPPIEAQPIFPPGSGASPKPRGSSTATPEL